MKVSIAERWAIVTWNRDEYSLSVIQKRLKEKFNKECSIPTIQQTIKRYHDTGDVKDRVRIRRKTARTQTNIEAVKKELFKKKTRNASPKKTPARIANTIKSSKSSVARMIKFDLQLKPYKQQQVQKLTEVNKEKRLARSRKLLRKYDEQDAKKIVFTDESVFPLCGFHNQQNTRVYARNRSDIPEEELLSDRQQFPKTLMVWCGVSAAGKLSLQFCKEGAKLNAKTYQEEILEKALPEAKRLQKGYIWQQDSAPSHSAASTQRFLQRNVPRYISSEEWPPYSPDLNVLDYCVWGALKQKVYSRSFSSLEDLKVVIEEEFQALPQKNIADAVKQWRRRLRLVVDCAGGHIEHLL